VTLNLALPEGQTLARELAKSCDVLVENYKVGDLERYGLDYGSLREVNSGLVYCSITGYGQNGPSAHKPGYDFVFQALGGLMSITGERDDRPGGGPQKVGIAVADVMTGMYATIAILAALNHRTSSGQGQYIDMALLDCIVAIGGNQATGFLTTGKVPKRYGNEHASLVPYQVFATADADIVVAVGNDAQWQRFCEAIARPDLAADDWKHLRTTDEIDKSFLLRDLLFWRGTGDRVAKSRARGCQPGRAAVTVAPHWRHPCAAYQDHAAAIG
jgi:crotonobetainyl-CoA:carnitine CoA-transferase CaiB-like acyl-CoA transferase